MAFVRNGQSSSAAPANPTAGANPNEVLFDDALKDALIRVSAPYQPELDRIQGEVWEAIIAGKYNQRLVGLARQNNSFCIVENANTEEAGLSYIKRNAVVAPGITINGIYKLGIYEDIFGVDYKHAREKVKDLCLRTNEVNCSHNKAEKVSCIHQKIREAIQKKIDEKLIIRCDQVDLEVKKILADLMVKYKLAQASQNLDILPSENLPPEPTEEEAYKTYYSKLVDEVIKAELISIMNELITPQMIKEKLVSLFGEAVASNFIAVENQENEGACINHILGLGIRDYNEINNIFTNFYLRCEFDCKYIVKDGDAYIEVNTPSITLYCSGSNGDKITLLEILSPVQAIIKAKDGKSKLEKVTCADPFILDIFRGKQYSLLEILEHYAPNYAPAKKHLTDNYYNLRLFDLNSTATDVQYDKNLRDAALQLANTSKYCKEKNQENDNNKKLLGNVFRTAYEFIKKTNDTNAQDDFISSVIAAANAGIDLRGLHALLNILEDNAKDRDIYKTNMYQLAEIELKSVVKSSEGIVAKIGDELLDSIREAKNLKEDSDELNKEKEINLASMAKSAARFIQKPLLQKRQEALLDDADKIVKYRGGKRVAGAAMILLGLGIMALSTVVAVASFGAMSPISVAGITIGASIITGAISTTVAVAGSGLVIGGAVGTHRLFGSKQRAAVVKAADNLLHKYPTVAV